MRGGLVVYTTRIRQPNRKSSLITERSERSHLSCNSFRWRQKMKRRDFFRNAGIGSATLVSLPALAQALTLPELAGSPLKQGELPANPFVVLLRGTYKPVKRCPDLGLFLVNICDGSYLTVKIYSESGLLEEDEEDREQVIGNFYVAPGMGKPVAYDLPGGALTMVFTGQECYTCPRRAGWDVHCGNLRPKHNGGDWRLSVFCQWS